MKNNREKLNHAFEGLRGDTLEGVMTVMESPVAGRSNRTRRLVTLTAACLAVVMMLGAVVAVPLLTAEDPTVPITEQNSVPNTAPSVAVPEENYPFVRVQALSASAENGEETADDSVSVNAEYSRIMLTFDLEEGETVEITSHNTLNRQTAVSKKLEELLLQYEKMELTESMLQTLERILYREIRHLEKEAGEAETELSEWEPDRVVIQITESSFLISKRLFWRTDASDVVDFVIRNEAGEIVGAGSVCFAMKLLYSSSMVRHEILGSKRFEAPVTEEEAAAYVDGLHENLETVMANMDFTPATAEEGYAVAETDLITTCYGDGKVLAALQSVLTNSASSWEFRFIYPRSRGEEPEDARSFIMFPDGTWGEIAEDSGWIYETCTDESCGAEEAPAEHEHYTGRILVLTDGRTVSLERRLYEDENGQTLEKYVPVFAPEVESA